MSAYQQIPTSIITGFLGAGKTTAIQHLLRHRPENERWAVIVNEFGQVGIDGALLANQSDDASQSVVVKEIPGGCLCCVSSQSFTVGLNQLIRSQKPQRIIIEPTGLGHPARLIETLSGEFYTNVIQLKAVITLLDARQLQDPRYTSHETYMDQVNMADILVASKSDLYSSEDLQNFYRFAAAHSSGSILQASVEQGQINPAWLELPRNAARTALHPAQHQHNSVDIEQRSDSEGWLQSNTDSDDFHSYGWQLDKTYVFSRSALIDWLLKVSSEQQLARVKAVMLTDQGWLKVNVSGQETDFEIVTDAEFESSRLECISAAPMASDAMDQALRKLVAG